MNESNDCTLKKELAQATTELNILKDKYQTLEEAVMWFVFNFHMDRPVSLKAEIYKLDRIRSYIACFGSDNKPIRCFECGASDLEAIQTSHLLGCKEFDIKCKTCGAKLNTWCNGVYSPAYKKLIDKLK